MMTQAMTGMMTQAEDKPQESYSSSELNSLYLDADSADQAIFAEMRSNLLLVAGEHYQRKDSTFFKRIRDTKELSDEQKLRLTKNHTRKITQAYVNNIMGSEPGVCFRPHNEKELHDKKVADMHHAIWRDAVARYSINDMKDDWCDSFVEIGEVAVKIFFDSSKGDLKGYEPHMHPETGEMLLDPMGQPSPDESKPIYMGEFVFEEVFGYNLLRPEGCKDVREAEWLCIRKMMSTDLLKHRYQDEDRQKYIQDSVDDTFMVFDAAHGGYMKAKGQVSVREYYFRPCHKYPKGYFYITTQGGILEEGELPGGIFPIVHQCFDKWKGTPRGRSCIKQMRPYQIEINRSASKMAEHQITLGDDKVFYQNGTKVSPGNVLPGVRSYSYTGATPTVLEGRSGAQYLEYMVSQIDEMYKVMNVYEDTETSNAQQDPYVELYKSARQKRKFKRYVSRYNAFLINLCKLYLKLAKVHMDDEAIVMAIGTSERVNIPEFKSAIDTCFEVNVEPQSDDIETMLGQQITINHALQYVGNKLERSDIGKMMRNMPFGNKEACFDDFTIDEDNATNDILAMERGEHPELNESDDHAYMAKRLAKRIKENDFRFLAPQIQEAFKTKKNLHEQMMAFQAEQLRRAEQGFIPTDGALITIDFYVPDPTSPTGRTKKAQVPYSSIGWLLTQLQAQGSMMGTLDGMDPGQQASVAQKISSQGQPAMPMSPGAAPNGMSGAVNGGPGQVPSNPWSMMASTA